MRRGWLRLLLLMPGVEKFSSSCKNFGSMFLSEILGCFEELWGTRVGLHYILCKWTSPLSFLHCAVSIIVRWGATNTFCTTSVTFTCLPGLEYMLDLQKKCWRSGNWKTIYIWLVKKGQVHPWVSCHRWAQCQWVCHFHTWQNGRVPVCTWWGDSETSPSITEVESV